MTHNDDHDTVVVDSGGSGMGAILGIIGILILLVAVWYFALGPGASPSTTNNNSNTVNPPAVSLPPIEPSAAP